MVVRAIVLAVCLAAAPSALAQVDAERFADPVAMRSAALSPDGQAVAYVLREDSGEFIVVADLQSGQRRRLTTIGTGAGRYEWVSWKGDQHVIFAATLNRNLATMVGSNIRIEGLELPVTRVLSISRDGGQPVQMFEGNRRSLYQYSSTFLLDPLPNEPGSVLLSAWDRSGHGVWRAEVATGRVRRVINGGFDTIAYATDGAGEVVLRFDALGRWGYRISRRDAGGRWRVVSQARRGVEVLYSPDFFPLAPGPGAGQVYVLARPDQRDLATLYLYNAHTGEFGAPLSEGAGVDATAPWIHPVTREVLATCQFARRLDCAATDPDMQRHLNALDAFFEHAATVAPVDMSEDANVWLLAVDGPTEAGGYYLYDRRTHRVDALGARHPSLDPAALSPTQTVDYVARDGAPLWAYVTAGPAQGPRPTVVLPHGGPEARDYYGYTAYVQFLASRGYVVVQPNFRGSEGFGRAFAAAGYGEWGRRMQDDVTDAVRHLIDTGVADPDRICIVGVSYGGYAALAGATLTPELYRCAISIAGVSDLGELLRTERAESGSGSVALAYWQLSVGDPARSISPAALADRVSAPILLMHGEEDRTVLIAQSERMQQALDAAGRPVRFVRLPGADHYWERWSREQRLTVFKETETFLAAHLGGD